jgi:hypothetical protein
MLGLHKVRSHQRQPPAAMSEFFVSLTYQLYHIIVHVVFSTHCQQIGSTMALFPPFVVASAVCLAIRTRGRAKFCYRVASDASNIEIAMKVNVGDACEHACLLLSFLITLICFLIISLIIELT